MTESSSTVREQARDIPVLESVDVLVAGGGVAGCAAAWSAARAGAKTILVERNGCLGGVATASLMANIGNMYFAAGGRQVVGGFASLLVDRLVAVGAASPKWNDPSVPGVCMDSERLKVVLIDMLQEAGVTVLTHALCARPIMEGQAVRGAFVESKSGRQAILAGNTVDASGEADLAWQAGAAMADKFGGSASILFKLARVDLDQFVEFLGQDPEGFPAGKDYVESCETLRRTWRDRGILFFPHWGGKHWRFFKQIVEAGEFQVEQPPAFGLNALGMYAFDRQGFVVVNSNFYSIKSLDVRQLSQQELHAQKMCFYVADTLRRKVPGFQDTIVAHVGVDLGIRTSRRIVGRSTMLKKDFVGPSADLRAADAIAQLPCEDEWETGRKFRSAYACDVPLGILVPSGCSHLLIGSAKSASTDPSGLFRGMTGCMVCGQGAGVAAAIGSRRGLPAAEAPIAQLQQELQAQGVRFGR